MDSSMINIALPTIMRSFSTTLAVSEWVVLIYLLTITVSLLMWGHLADCFGQGKIYILGMMVFTLGSAGCYFSPFLSFLIFCRFIQGLGAAMMMSSGPAIIKIVFPKDQLGRSLGLLGIATSVGLMTGPAISGFLIRFYTWRAIFLVTIPISFLAFVLGWHFMKKSLPGGAKKSAVSFDWYGGMLWTVLMSCVVIFMSHGKDLALYYKIFGLLGFVGIIIIFWKTETKQKDPFVPYLLLKRKYLAIASITVALSFIVLFIILILMPFFMDFVLGYPADKIGYVMMAVPLTLFVVSPFSGWLFDQIGARFLTTSGLVLCLVAILFLCLLDQQSTPIDIAWRLVLLGTGQSLFLSPNTASVLARIERRYTGVTSGMLATARNVGMLLGVAIAGMVFSAFFYYFSGGHDLKEFSSSQNPAFLLAFQTTLMICAVLAVIGGIVSVMRE